MILPQTFHQTITTTFADGDRWLVELPEQITYFERLWGIKIGRIFPLSYNFLAAATALDGTAYVLKLGVPRAELSREIAALQLYAGCGIAKLIASDAKRGALLLERLQPGIMLASLNNPDEAVQIGAEVMANLWQPLPEKHSFHTVQAWADGLQKLRLRFNGGTGPLPERMVNSAETIFHDLFASTETPILLHGDLHHYNILSSHRGNRWLAIDPKGMVGECAYETGTFIRNHIAIYTPKHNPARLIDQCVAIFSERFGIDRQRIRDHAFAQAVLSAWWSIEDGVDGWETAVAVAEML